jgi:hypothetical protein
VDHAHNKTLLQIPVLLALVAALALGISAGSPARADASLSEYCPNVTLNGFETCNAAPRTLYAVFGWGDQHAVCVGALQGGGVACSSNPGEGAYAPTTTAYTYPWISNRAAGSNRVHGVAYQP